MDDKAARQATPCVSDDDAMTRSGTWMAAGSPAHEFAGEPGERWCRECGCGRPGWQHHRDDSLTPAGRRLAALLADRAGPSAEFPAGTVILPDQDDSR